MDVQPLLDNLERYVRANDYAGYDPYDALNSPILRVLTGRSWFLRKEAIVRLPPGRELAQL